MKDMNQKKEYCVPALCLLALTAGDLIAASGERPAVLTRTSTGDGDNWDW